MTSFLYSNAYGRYASVRLGMSNHHSMWMRITLERDMKRISECVITTSERSKFGQV